MFDLSTTEWAESPAYDVINAAVFAARGSVNGYPDHSAVRVRELLAERHGLQADQFVLGNGAGNLLQTKKVGLLFIDLEGRKRMRLNGVASVDDDDPLLPEYPEAQLVVRVSATEVFPNCPRYIHEYKLVARSRFVPKSECETPVPQWKRSDWANDVLPEGDPADDPDREVIARG